VSIVLPASGPTEASEGSSWDRDDDDVTHVRGFLWRGGTRVRTELGDEVGMSSPARVSC